MNKKALDILGYNKIVELLQAETECQLSRDIIAELYPDTNIRAVRKELRSTTEAVDLIMRKGALPTGGINDIESAAGFAKKGGCLTAGQLLSVRYNLTVAEDVRRFLKTDVPDVPLIMSLAELIHVNRPLASDIGRAVLSEDEIADNASSELGIIRKKIAHQHDAVRDKLNRIVNSRANKAYLQESIVTVKDGRYVVPVKQEHRAKFPGIIHDRSRGGTTLFIEPQSIVNMNNELRELEIAEQSEISRILTEFSGRVGECAKELINNQVILSKLEFIMAKGRFSLKLKGSAPEIDENGAMDLKNARHPLIEPEKVVPISMSLGKNFKTLVITGPNTGGKTVTLKTVGLLSLMMQSGLHIPASETSTMPVFKEVFADIGDEQSIEQSLSTFSSHMKNIVEIIEKAGDNSLVLLDELGAGTDPTEGAALAIAILEKISLCGAMTVATTHYNEIKKYAIATDGVENASMEFDVETLSPTYRLLMGATGSSNAFLISGKLGLPETVIERAGDLLQSDDIKFERILAALERDKKKAEEERDEAINITREIRAEQRKAELDRKEFTNKKEKLMEDAKTEARRIIREAKQTADEVRRELKELAKMESLGERTRNFDESRRKLKEKEGEYARRIVRQVNSTPVKAEDLKIGAAVKVLSLNQNGELIGLPDNNDEVQVQLGIMKTKVGIDDIMLISAGNKKGRKKSYAPGIGSMLSRKALNVKSSLDVRGKSLDSAMIDVGKYMDDAFVAGLKTVTVIHGKGDGILRKGIRDFLRENRNIVSFRAGSYGEGDEGVTVVTLKTR